MANRTIHAVRHLVGAACIVFLYCLFVRSLSYWEMQFCRFVRVFRICRSDFVYSVVRLLCLPLPVATFPIICGDTTLPNLFAVFVLVSLLGILCFFATCLLFFLQFRQDIFVSDVCAGRTFVRGVVLTPLNRLRALFVYPFLCRKEIGILMSGIAFGAYESYIFVFH